MPRVPDELLFEGVCETTEQWSHGGRELFYGFFHRIVTDNVTAFAGGGQADATVLGTSVSIVTLVASAGDSVKLPPGHSIGGAIIYVYNDGANDLDVFPQSGHEIVGAGGVDTAVSVSPGNWLRLISRDETTWLQLP